MDENFEQEYDEIKNESLLLTNSYYFSHMDFLADSFRNAMKEACAQVRQMQERGLGDVEYMEVTMLRTRLMKQDFRAPILVYGPDWYADLGQREAGAADVEPIYSFYRDMLRATSRLVKKYRSKLPERILEECMCQMAEPYWNYVELACRQAVMGFTPEGMRITDDFRIRCCEYMGFGTVCRRHTPAMTLKEMQLWFDKREDEEVYRFRDYRGLDFSGWSFAGMDLTGCDFSRCNLENCDFSGADLTGAWFYDSWMNDACMEEAWLPGARFHRADLENATFEGAYSACEINDGLWLRPDNERASFLGANLKYVDFTFSSIECADFSGAVMDGAIMNDGHREFYQLDERQRAAVQFCDF